MVTPAVTPLLICAFEGENVVRGHRESVKNLLEIFEGLLEYLMEEMSEESQNGGLHKSFVGGVGGVHRLPNCFDEDRLRSTKQEKT